MRMIKRKPFIPGDPRQRQQIIELLTEAFGNYEPFYQLALSTVASPESTLLYYREEALIAHIQLVEYIGYLSPQQQLRIAYLYAVCTAQEAQGQGIMRQILQETLEQLPTWGYDAAALVPAEVSLVDYYRPFGFISTDGIAARSVAKGTYPVIRPGQAAQHFEQEALRLNSLLYGEEPSPPLTLVAGWMLHPLRATVDTLLLPLSTPFESPMQ